MEAELKCWWVLRDTEKLGPYGRNELRAMGDAGQLYSTDRLWKDGLKEPVPASQVTGLHVEAGEPPLAPDDSPSHWWVLADNGNRQGPYTEAELTALVQSGQTGADTSVFCAENKAIVRASTALESFASTTVATARPGRTRAQPQGAATVTGLSGNEIYCLAKKDYWPGELVVGNSVNSMGFLGSIGAGLGTMLGGEIPQVTNAIHEGRAASFDRMSHEARHNGADGIAGVTSELRSFNGSTEFLFVGSCVHAKAPGGRFFTSAGSTQELYCHLDAGYMPLQHVFGNIAYSMGVGGGIVGALRTLARGEVPEFSDVFNRTRHAALSRVVEQARREGANAVVGIRTTILRWMGTHEMLMTGTATINHALPQSYASNPVTSDLTGEELWAMTSLGYYPLKLLMSTSIYSLGFVGGFMAAFKSFVKGEITELSTLIHDARENAIARLRGEAAALGADQVVGVKTYIAEIGNGLVEFVAIGTAMKAMTGLATATPSLPVQAIAPEKDTWIDGDWGFTLDRK